jgi:hypothetical protein
MRPAWWARGQPKSLQVRRGGAYGLFVLDDMFAVTESLGGLQVHCDVAAASGTLHHHARAKGPAILRRRSWSASRQD